MNLKWVSDQTVILETQDIFQNSSSGDLSTTNHVWNTNNINICFELLETLPKAPITSGIIFVLTLCSVLIALAKSIYLLAFSFSLLTILWSWGIGRYINQLPLSFFWHLQIISGLLCFIFVVVLISTSQRISIPVWVTVYGNGTCSYQFLVTFISYFLHNSQWRRVAIRLCLII